MSTKGDLNKDDYKPYTAKRWTDAPMPVVVKRSVLTPEERERSTEMMNELLEQYGIKKRK